MKITRISQAIVLSAACAVALVAALPHAIAQDKPVAKVKPYPLKTCLISGEKLEGMGSPYVFTNDTREIKLCCKGCLKDFEKNPAKYIKKLEIEEKKLTNKAVSAPPEMPGEHQHLH